MKLFLGFFWTLVLITVFAQFGSSKIITKREELNYENGTDIVVVKPGPLDIVLNGKNLTFVFCGDNCIEDFLACYEPASANQSAFLKHCDSKCGFYVNANPEVFSFMNPIEKVMPFGQTKNCFETSMKYNQTNVYEGVDVKGVETINSCDPKIENGMIQLNITKAGSGCPMTIKNAKFYKEKVPTPGPTENPSNNENPETAPKDPSSASKIMENYFGWIFVLFISFYLL